MKLDFIKNLANDILTCDNIESAAYAFGIHFMSDPEWKQKITRKKVLEIVYEVVNEQNSG